MPPTCLLLYTVASAQRNSTYRVEVVERVLGPDGGSILSYENTTSDFNYTFAPAYFPAPEDGSGPDGLLLRVQRAAQVGAHSGIAVVRRVGAPHSMTFEKADDSKLIRDGTLFTRVALARRVRDVPTS